VELRKSKSEIRNTQIGNGKTPNAHSSVVCSFAFFFLVICLAFRFSDFGFAATSPTTKPDPITTWFQDLANRDATVREQARINLMGISRDDLEKLHTLVEADRPLAPSQAMALREIVDQVYQATDPYEPFEDHSGFLGVPQTTSAVVLDGGEDDSQGGVLVAKRIPGFCAYRFLQDGDMIVGIAEATNRPIRAWNDLTGIIKNYKGGDTIHIEVLRGGQKIQVPVKLDVRPIWAPPPFAANQVLNQVPNGSTTQDAIRERQRKADDYWDKNFAPLLDGGLL